MEQALKQRLVGAAVIIALGIIVIPIVLDRAGERQLRKIPDAPRPGLQSRPGFVDQQDIELPSDEHSGQIVLTLPQQQSNAAVPDKSTAKDTAITARDAVNNKAHRPEPQTSKPATLKPAPATKPVAKVPETKKTVTDKVVAQKPQIQAVTSNQKKSQTGAWVVQVGSFTDPKKAFKLRDQLLKKKYKAFVEKIKGRSGQNLYRVRVGPLPEKEQASTLSGKLAQQGFKGYVTRHP